jgi:hypothetical protein
MILNPTGLYNFRRLLAATRRMNCQPRARCPLGLVDSVEVLHELLQFI